MSDNMLRLPFWEGFHVSCFERHADQLHITLNPAGTGTCSGCGEPCDQVHEYRPRLIRDLPILGLPVYLHAMTRRLSCAECGHRAEHISWLERCSRLTQRLAETVSRCCARLSIRHVAELFDLHWETVRRLDQRRLLHQISLLSEAQPRRLVMDKFALYKGHRYATVVMDADNRRVLWIGEGRSREAIRPFFIWSGPQHCAAIEAVAMDINTAFDLEVQQHCPGARVVYDLFHVIAEYGREVIDPVRVDEASRLREDRPARCLVKRARWLLLRHPENLNPAEQRIRLQDLQNANRSLMTVYLMKASLKALWSPGTDGDWRRA